MPHIGKGLRRQRRDVIYVSDFRSKDFCACGDADLKTGNEEIPQSVTVQITDSDKLVMLSGI